jgi:hypothetical protein
MIDSERRTVLECVVVRGGDGDMLNFDTFDDDCGEASVKFESTVFKAGEMARAHCEKYGLKWTDEMVVCIGEMTAELQQLQEFVQRLCF